jgi:hypothetical protein
MHQFYHGSNKLPDDSMACYSPSKHVNGPVTTSETFAHVYEVKNNIRLI